ncbi:MAG: glycosyltransferase family 4 protein [Rickettsiales bacterium]|nr:glycosyltransferase family 4 protein [Rickettsiales bacterium]
MAKILHITAHLGGGVGRALSQLALHDTTHDHAFLCLEPPEKPEIPERLKQAGIPVTIAPRREDAEPLLQDADILQIEWWHHPLMLAWLCAAPLHGRLLFWSHTSGLHYPAFAPGMTALPHRFVFTSAASCNAPHAGEHTYVVPSSGGLDDFPLRPECTPPSPLRYGYVGSLNPAKLHPEFATYLDAVPREDFSVACYGDIVPDSPAHRTTRARIMGFHSDPAEVYAGLEVLVYLLHPLHYGTTENALLEAMACGVVPIVGPHAVETSIVKHGETGLVVDSPAAFAEAATYLEDHPEAWRAMSRAATQDIRQRFSLGHTLHALGAHYAALLQEPPRSCAFTQVFGTTPETWFLRGMGGYSNLFTADRTTRLRYPFLYETHKSSARHFLQYFPDSPALQRMVRILEEDQHAD